MKKGEGKKVADKKESKGKGPFDRFRDNVAGVCATDIKNHSEICAADIIKTLEKSDLDCRDEVLKYLNDNKVPKYSDDDIRQILENQKRIDEMEVQQSALVSNYRTAIKLALALCIGFILVIEVVLGVEVITAPLTYKYVEVPSSYLNYAFLISTATNILIAFIIIKHNTKWLRVVYSISWTVLLLFVIGVRFWGSAPNIGVVNAVCCILILCFRAFYSMTDTLNKSDSYNIMILILTLLALAVGIYSLMLTKQSMAQATGIISRVKDISNYVAL